MKVAAITGERKCMLVDKPDPKAAGEFVVVKITAAPMCTEYKAYKGGGAADCLGHEAAGEVVEVAQPGRVKVGDRVVVMPLYPCGKCAHCLAGQYIHCQTWTPPPEACGPAGTATYAQYTVKPDWMLLPVPDGMSIDHASMACCGFGPTFGAMERMNVNALDTVLVTGLGPVGLGAVVNASYRGARVIAVDSNTYRADLAMQLGAERVIDPTADDALAHIRDATGGGVDKGVDCSGAPQAQRLMLDALLRRGQMCFVGEGGELTLRISTDMIRKGVSLHGQWHWGLADAPKMMKMIAETGDRIDRMITHTFPMREVGKAWELQLTGNCGKIILHPWE